MRPSHLMRSVLRSQNKLGQSIPVDLRSGRRLEYSPGISGWLAGRVLKPTMLSGRFVCLRAWLRPVEAFV